MSEIVPNNLPVEIVIGPHMPERGLIAAGGPGGSGPFVNNLGSLPVWDFATSGTLPQPVARVEVLLPDGREPAITISPNGMVVLSPRLCLDMVKDLPLWQLQAMRAVLDEAIRDQTER